MRVTSNMITDQLQRNINRGLSRLQKLQLQLASNKAIQEASDDPVGASIAVGLRAAVAAREQYQKNGLSVKDRLNASEDALNGIQALLTTVQGVAVKGASDTQGQEERGALADQINQSLEELSDLSRSRFGEDYLFGGTEITSAPYTPTVNGSRPTILTGFNAVTDPAASLDAAGLPGSVTTGSLSLSIYNAAGAVTAAGPVAITAGATTLNGLAAALTALGVTASVGGDNRLTITAPAGGSFSLSNDTSGVVQALGVSTFVPGETSAMAANPKGVSGQQPREILEGVSLRANVTGTEVFSQSVDLFQTLITLRDALRANNTQSISSSLTGLKTGISQVTAALGSVGSRVQRVNAIHETLTTDIARLKSLQSRIEDTDMAATTLDYQQQQTLYQASLQMGARMIQSSLLDFLR